MSQDISELFTAPASGIKGIANLFVSVGTVIGVDPNTLTCTVLSNQGLLENVRLTLPLLSKGTGVYMLPNIGDICAVSFTVQGDPYITGYGVLNGLKDLQSFDRVNLDYNSIILTSNKRSFLAVSDDIHLATASGNHLLLNNNTEDPAIVLEGSNRVTVRTGVGPDASTIDIIKDANANKTTLSIKPNGRTVSALTLEFTEEGKVKMIIDQELTIKVPGGDGTPLTTVKQVKDFVSACTYIPSLYPAPNPATISTDVANTTFTGITGLKTEGTQ